MIGKLVFETEWNVYSQESVIGEGGSGIVYKVRNEDGDLFALKHLRPRTATTEKLKRFRNELSFCQKNEHPNILKVLDSGFVRTDRNKSFFYVMRLYEKTLRDIMSDGLAPDAVLPWYIKILAGVREAHKCKVWHRDLKPENILVGFKRRTCDCRFWNSAF